MKKSTHRVEIVELNLEKHPNADSLSIQKVFGYQVVLRTADWEGVKYGAYLVPDSVVDTELTEFNWLSPENNKNFRPANGPEDKRFHRVTVMRLRGAISYGLMIQAPEGSKPGDDVSDVLKVTRYQPLLISEGQAPAPEGYNVEYDLEAFERYADDMFVPGEQVYCFEKLDGVNSRYCFRDGKMHVGSRTIWLQENPDSSWYKNLKNNPQIRKFCEDNPDSVLYGEIVGYPKGFGGKLRYGQNPGETDFYVFDILHGTEFLDIWTLRQVCIQYDFKLAPLVSVVDYNFENLIQLSDGVTLVENALHKREGIVVRPTVERRNHLGRVVLKIVSPKFLMS